MIPGGKVELAWRNLPAHAGSEVWVDVWFGRDPVSDFRKVVDRKAGVSSIEVEAPVAGTYYWRVDSYLEGRPSGTPVQSARFSFIVDDTDGDGLPDGAESNTGSFRSAADTAYRYTVTLRDALGNVGVASGPSAVTTEPESPPGGDAESLTAAFRALADHIEGKAELTGAQISAHKATIDAKAGFIGSHSSAIQASFDLIATYDRVIGPIFVDGSPVQSFPRNNSDESIHWVVYSVMQTLMDKVYTLDKVLAYDYLFEGFAFGSADFFPGHADPPADPDAIYTVAIDANYPDTWGDDTMYSGTPARKPTGAYVAPGATAKVRVPPSIVGRGYTVRVGAHSWDFSNKPTIKRLDRVSRVLPIDRELVEVANPLGGGIYTVPLAWTWTGPSPGTPSTRSTRMASPVTSATMA